ncbi:hypothetical protein H4R33_003293 [Dimargaris cristalligena]|nr:hypothetical protein H4R33_003293 [Dimargaris cristalligena]
MHKYSLLAAGLVLLEHFWELQARPTQQLPTGVTNKEDRMAVSFLVHDLNGSSDPTMAASSLEYPSSVYPCNTDADAGELPVGLVPSSSSGSLYWGPEYSCESADSDDVIDGPVLACSMADDSDAGPEQHTTNSQLEGGKSRPDGEGRLATGAPQVTEPYPNRRAIRPFIRRPSASPTGPLNSENPYQRVTCPKCEKSLANAPTLQNHQTKPGQCSFFKTCPDCPHQFHRTSDYTRHTQNGCKTSKSICADCQKTFKSPSLLKQHRFHRFGETNTSCKRCMQVFLNALAIGELTHRSNIGDEKRDFNLPNIKIEGEDDPILWRPTCQFAPLYDQVTAHAYQAMHPGGAACQAKSYIDRKPFEWAENDEKYFSDANADIAKVKIEDWPRCSAARMPIHPTA